MKIADGPPVVVRLALNVVAFTASATAVCCFSTVYWYWYHELDADCPDRGDCKCALFGTSLADGFVGGERFACRYVTYSTLASTSLAAFATVYYGCATLLCRRRRRHRRHRPADDDDDDRRRARRPRVDHVQLDDENVSPQITGLNVCFAIVLGVMALNMFISSAVLSNGYITTCRQYVHRVKSFLMVSGNMVELVSERMSCGTIYDFLDYLQPRSRQVAYELIHRHKTNSRDFVINTSLLMVISIAMSWLSTTIWTALTFFVFYLKK